MNYAVILAGGKGQRSASSGLPKQFVKFNEKPIILYTIDKFVNCKEVQVIVIVCIPEYIDYMKGVLSKYKNYDKQIFVIAGGDKRQLSVQCGVSWIKSNGGMPDDLVIIHDGVRPFVDISTIKRNIEIAKQKKCAITVRPVTETVIVTDSESVKFENFLKRDDSFCLTSPQTFCLSILEDIYNNIEVEAPIPLLDSALLFSYLGGEVPIVKECNYNIKITNTEDYYIFSALLEFEDNKNAFGL